MKIFDQVSKAIGASVGGATVASAGVAFAAPEGTPWWGYLLAYFISMIVPAITTYLAAPNSLPVVEVEPDVVNSKNTISNSKNTVAVAKSE